MSECDNMFQFIGLGDGVVFCHEDVNALFKGK